MSALNRNDFRVLALLKMGGLVRTNGAWRFGLAGVADSVVDRLKASGRVTHLFPGGEGECIISRSHRPWP